MSNINYNIPNTSEQRLSEAVNGEKYPLATLLLAEAYLEDISVDAKKIFPSFTVLPNASGYQRSFLRLPNEPYMIFMDDTQKNIRIIPSHGAIEGALRSLGFCSMLELARKEGKIAELIGSSEYGSFCRQIKTFNKKLKNPDKNPDEEFKNNEGYKTLIKARQVANGVVGKGEDPIDILDKIANSIANSKDGEGFEPGN